MACRKAKIELKKILDLREKEREKHNEELMYWRENICPHCGYSGRLIPATTSDGNTLFGFVQCPECNKQGWRL